jgi:hypothetical protein
VVLKVTIDSTELSWITDFERTKKSVISVPNFISADETIDENVWIKKLDVFEYTFRASDAEKWIFDKKLLEHKLHTLDDSIHDIHVYVWIISIDSEWVGDRNFAYPWKVTISLLNEANLLENIVDFIITPENWFVQTTLPLYATRFPFGYINLQIDITRWGIAYTVAKNIYVQRRSLVYCEVAGGT